MAYISFNPYSCKEIARYGSDSEKMLSVRISDVHEAWREWRCTDISLRVSLLLRLADNLEANENEHAATIVAEMGKPVSQALAEVRKCSALCRYYAGRAESLLEPRAIDSSATSSVVKYSPQGIVLGIMPWNFPYWQAFRFFIPALVSGNAAILKHASNVTGSALMMEKLIRDAGFPENIFRVILPEHSHIEYVISRPEIRGVALTGSNYAGSIVASLAGRYMKKSVLELGGSDPFIVLPDADIEAAVEGAVMGRFLNCGQSCIAAKRIFIHKSLYSRFLDLFISSVDKLVIGDPSDQDVFIGPMVNSKSVDEIAGQVERSVSMGARLLLGGERGSEGPAFYIPAVMTDIPSGSPMESEEVFGPAAPLFRYDNIDQVIEMANNSRFGLGASVWSEDVELAMNVADVIDSGTVAINGFTRSDPAVPFGGVKESGYGRELSVEGLHEFVNIKSITTYSR